MKENSRNCQTKAIIIIVICSGIKKYESKHWILEQVELPNGTLVWNIQKKNHSTSSYYRMRDICKHVRWQYNINLTRIHEIVGIFKGIPLKVTRKTGTFFHKNQFIRVFNTIPRYKGDYINFCREHTETRNNFK